MSGVPFEILVEETRGAAVLHLRGDVDRSAQGRLDAAAETVATDPILLDFGEVGYINSTGIAVIVGLLARMRAEGRAIRAYGLSDHYREIFQITRIADFMGIYEDEAAAVAAG